MRIYLYKIDIFVSASYLILCITVYLWYLGVCVYVFNCYFLLIIIPLLFLFSNTLFVICL